MRMRPVLAIACALLFAAVSARSAFAVTPGTKHVMEPKQAGMNAEAVTFPSARDSVTLHGWWIEATPASPVIVLCPRGKGTMADLLPSAHEFVARGFSVMTFDLREFGPGGPGEQDSLANLIFATRWVDDAQGAFTYARARAKQRFVFGWGQDLGSALVVAVGARDHSLVDAITCEGLFRTAQEQLLWNGTAQVPDVARRHRVLVDGQDEPLSTVPLLRSPLQVILAGKDTVTPPKTTREVTRQSLSRIDRLELPTAGHDGAETTPGYFDSVAGWFKTMARLLPPHEAPAATP